MTGDPMIKCLARAAALAALALAGRAQAIDNPIARAPSAPPPIQGTWYGTDLERRSNCTSAQNNGSHGTYAQYDLAIDTVTRLLTMQQTGITGLSCTYSGAYDASGAQRAWNGTYGCTDGKHGSFDALGIAVSENGLAIHLAIRLDTSESCAIDAVIGAGRFYP